MKIVSWNVNGLRAVVGKGFAEAFKALDADVLCLQETKLQEGQIDLSFPGYRSWWSYADKKGYSGTAIFSRAETLGCRTGIGIPEHDTEGRTITIELPEYYIVNVYVPNSQDGLRRLDYRMRWEDAFRSYLKGLEDGVGGRAAKPVVVCGDMNVAHEEIDLKNPDTNHFNAGFSDQERGKMSELLAAGFVDTWRYQHPGEVKYSWWSYRMRARERNAGWRIDYFLVSEALKDRIVSTDIHNEIFGSDHCPVELVLR